MTQPVKLKLNILQRLLNSAQVSMKPILNVPKEYKVSRLDY